MSSYTEEEEEEEGIPPSHHVADGQDNRREQKNLQRSQFAVVGHYSGEGKGVRRGAGVDCVACEDLPPQIRTSGSSRLRVGNRLRSRCWGLEAVDCFRPLCRPTRFVLYPELAWNHGIS